jgi:hypothetical protein
MYVSPGAYSEDECGSFSFYYDWSNYIRICEHTYLVYVFMSSVVIYEEVNSTQFEKNITQSDCLYSDCVTTFIHNPVKNQSNQT